MGAGGRFLLWFLASCLSPTEEGHGVNGSTSVSKTESLGSNPSAPAKPNLLVPLAARLGPTDKRRK